MVTDLLQGLLEWQAERNPDNVALICDGREQRYRCLDAQANRIGHWLRQSGVAPKDRVLLFGPNQDRLVAALFGILKAGATCVPVHPQTPTRKLEFILQDCSPKAIVTDSQLLDAHQCIGSHCGQAVLLTSDAQPARLIGGASFSSWNALNFLPEYPPDPGATSDDLAAIIYTSGSTKEPRGVMEPHRQILFATHAINAVLQNSADDVILCGIPLSFDYGLYQIFLAFEVGATLVLERDFAVPMNIPRLLRTHNVTGFPGVPSIFALLLRSRLLERVDLPDLRYITSTGDVLPPSHVRLLHELLPHVTIFPMYGLTECKRVSIVPAGQLDGRESSVGLPLPGTQVAVIDTDGREVTPGAVGELVVRGPHVMAGYWNDPVETKRRFRHEQRTAETSLYTGDFLWQDKDGFLFFVGRDGTFIKTHGQKVSPSEIEAFLCEIDGIAEAAVVGVPDQVLGESAWVYVYLSRAGCMTHADILERCKALLSPIERPRHIEILQCPLPKTAHGKTDRGYLRKMAMESSDYA